MFWVILLMSGGINVSKPVAILRGQVSLEVAWDHKGKRLALIKNVKIRGNWNVAIGVNTAEKIGDDLYEWTVTVISIWDGDSMYRLVRVESSYVYYLNGAWSPDDSMLLCEKALLSSYNWYNYVIIDVNQKKIIREIPYWRDKCLHEGKALVWDKDRPHDVKWVPEKEYLGFLREQKHHWPEWMKERWKEERRIQGMYLQAKMKKKKINKEEINKIKQIRKEPGHFFTKVLERDDKGYVEKAELWAYPVGREPYLSMDEKTYGGIWGFSPNHKYMVIVGKDNNLYIAHSDGSDVTKVTEKAREDYYYFGIYWSPDSKKFVYVVTSKKYLDEKGVWLVKIEE